jgi:sugar lactone lactonase YvrE
MNRLLVYATVGAALVATNAAAKQGLGKARNLQHPALQEVASFDHQVTGVTVARDGRIFVNFPRWTEDAPVSVAELKPDGTLIPFPNNEWNAWRNARRDQITPHDHWVCVQSVVADHKGDLWVLDPGAPAQSLIVAGAPKLVKIDLGTDKVVQTIAFDEAAAPQGSYLNDVRFSPDDKVAYITDSGAKGALLVVDIASGKTRRLLSGDPSTQPEKDVQVKTDGKVLRRTDGRGVEFSADGIALSNDGRCLYWQAIKGKTLYRIDTAVLRDAGLDARALAGKVEKVGENGPADGLLIGRDDVMYISAVEDNAIKVRRNGRVSVLFQDSRLRWPDTFAQGADGMIYITSSRIMDMCWFKPGNKAQLPTKLYRFDPAGFTGDTNMH